MHMSELIEERFIRLNFTATDKWDAIAQLVDVLVEEGVIPAERRKAVLDVVYERERSVTTGMERGIAIPHANSKDVQEVSAAFGISKDGVEFESLDGEPAHLVILLVIPRNTFQQHVRTLAGIARLLHHQDIVENLKRCETPAQVMELIRNEEARDLL